jgi:hypothetical protein
MSDTNDNDDAIDATVSGHIANALDAVNSAVEAQRGDPGNNNDPNDMAVMSGLMAVQSRLGGVAESQQLDMGEIEGN